MQQTKEEKRKRKQETHEETSKQEKKTISAINRRVFSFNEPTNQAKAKPRQAKAEAKSFINRIGGSDQIVDRGSWGLNWTATRLWRQNEKQQKQLRAAAGQAKIGLLQQGCGQRMVKRGEGGGADPGATQQVSHTNLETWKHETSENSKPV